RASLFWSPKVRSMPSRSNPRPSSKSRKPGPFMPGSLILLLTLVALFFALVLYGPFANSKQIAFSDFLRLASEGELKKVVFVGKDRAMGVAKESEKEWIKKLELPKGQFNVSLPPAQDRMPLAEEIRAKNPDVQIDSEEEHGAWVGPALSALLMTMLLLGVL